MSWTLRYAAHLGFRSPDHPLFPASAGSAAPLSQIDYAASIGFAGVQDPWFASRPREQQDAIAARLRGHKLQAGCVVCGAREEVRAPLWLGDRATVLARLDQTIEAAGRLGATQIAVLTGADPSTPRADLIARFTEHLAAAAARAGEAGMVLCLEPTNARTLPGMLMAHFDEGVAIAEATGSPHVRMIYDTAHIQSMDGDLLGRLERHKARIEIVQIANHPGRTEPAIGEIAMAEVLRQVRRNGYQGLVELEHLWAVGGSVAEQRGLEWLQGVDAELA